MGAIRNLVIQDAVRFGQTQAQVWQEESFEINPSGHLDINTSIWTYALRVKC